jgi:hypothetical protein
MTTATSGSPTWVLVNWWLRINSSRVVRCTVRVFSFSPKILEGQIRFLGKNSWTRQERGRADSDAPPCHDAPHLDGTKPTASTSFLFFFFFSLLLLFSLSLFSLSTLSPFTPLSHSSTLYPSSQKWPRKSPQRSLPPPARSCPPTTCT